MDDVYFMVVVWHGVITMEVSVQWYIQKITDQEKVKRNKTP